MGKCVLCFLVLLVSFEAIDSMTISLLFRHFNIEIVNDLRFQKLLKIHCQEKDLSLGLLFLEIGDRYNLKFIVFPKTLFWCSFWQGPNFKHHVRFNAFDATGDFVYNVCGGDKPNKCTWSAREDGVYVHNNFLRIDILLYKWDTPTSSSSQIPPAAATTNTTTTNGP